MRTAVAALLSVAAVGGLARTASASPTARLGASVMVALLAGVIVGVARGRRWAVGSAFWLGLLALWATTALAVQGELPLLAALGGIAWALAVMVGSVKGNPRG